MNLPWNACSPCPYWDGECLCKIGPTPEDAECYDIEQEKGENDETRKQKTSFSIPRKR